MHGYFIFFYDIRKYFLSCLYKWNAMFCLSEVCLYWLLVRLRMWCYTCNTCNTCYTCNSISQLNLGEASQELFPDECSKLQLLELSKY